MNDPYDTVRIISERSIGQWPDFGYDFLERSGPRSEKIDDQLRAVHDPSLAGKSLLLFDDSGNLAMPRLRALQSQRNQRIVELLE